MRLSNHIKLTATDRKHIIILTIIAAVTLITTIIYNQITTQQSKKAILADTSIKNKISWLEEQTNEQEQEEIALSRLDKKIISIYDTIKLFNFDPNTVTTTQLKKLGLTEKQITTIDNYRKNGGKFTTKEDFRKIYGIRTKQYQILSPYITLKSEKEITYNNKKIKTPEYQTFDPNFVTEQQLLQMNFTQKQISTFINDRTQKGRKFYCINDVKNYFLFRNRFPDIETYIKIDLKKLANGKNLYNLNQLTNKDLEAIGIKPTEANEIVKARQILGAFYSISQLRDIGINLSKEIKNTLYICSGEILKKIKINDATQQELEQHPYITAKQAQSIIDYKNQNGKISNIETIEKIGLFDQWQLKKLEKYVEF